MNVPNETKGSILGEGQISRKKSLSHFSRRSFKSEEKISKISKKSQKSQKNLKNHQKNLKIHKNIQKNLTRFESLSLFFSSYFFLEFVFRCLSREIFRVDELNQVKRNQRKLFKDLNKRNIDFARILLEIPGVP